jgi:hypothetical protein
VDLTGQMDDSGQLIVKLNYQPVQDSVTIHCYSLLNGWTENRFTVTEGPRALSISVPAEGGATVATRAQALVNVKSNFSALGQATLIVEPEAEEATSAQPERQIGGLGLADRFRLWPGAHEAFAAWAR